MNSESRMINLTGCTAYAHTIVLNAYYLLSIHSFLLLNHGRLVHVDKHKAPAYSVAVQEKKCSNYGNCERLKIHMVTVKHNVDFTLLTKQNGLLPYRMYLPHKRFTKKLDSCWFTMCRLSCCCMCLVVCDPVPVIKIIITHAH